MQNCTNLYFLSTIACKLAECLPEKELDQQFSHLTLHACTAYDHINHIAHQQ